MVVTRNVMTHIKYSSSKYDSFRFDAGCLSLNFVATVRHRASNPCDLVSTPNSLFEWLMIAGLLHSPVVPNPEEHRVALQLRESIYNTVQAASSGGQVRKKDIDRINESSAVPLANMRLVGEACSLTVSSPHMVVSGLAAIARDAVLLVGTNDRTRFKNCAHPDCRMLFLTSLLGRTGSGAPCPCAEIGKKSPHTANVARITQQEIETTMKVRCEYECTYTKHPRIRQLRSGSLAKYLGIPKFPHCPSHPGGLAQSRSIAVG